MEKLDAVKNFYYAHKKPTILVAGAILLAVLIAMTCAFNGFKEIEVVVDQNTVLSKAAAPETKETVKAGLHSTVEEVLASEGYDYAEDYTVSVDLGKAIKDVDGTVTIKKNAQGNLIADGNTVAYNSGAETVGDLLSEKNISVDADDVVSPAATTPLTTEIGEVKVVRVETKEMSREQEIPFETEEKENAALAEGTVNVLTQGVNGKANVVEKVTYNDGQEVGREVLSSTTTLEPVKQVQEKGTLSSTAAAAVASGGSAGNTTQSAGSDLDMICAIVAHEGGTSYEGALAVISCVMNRVDSGAWGGSTALGVLTAPGQFASYLDGYYTQYMGAAIPEVRQAVSDCMEGGIRSHSYKSFRSYQTSGSVQIAGGNWYFN